MERPTRDSIDDFLTEEIMSGRLAAGARLPAERELAERFRLSRPTVREVLRGLQERGLVEIVPAQGTFVRAPTTADGARSLESYYRRRNATARELMDARLMLETHAVQLAAACATPPELRLLEICLLDCEGAGNVIDRARHDLRFHGLLARASHNSVIETMFASIATFTFELMLRSLADPAVAQRGLPYHRAVLDAIRAGEPGQAEEAMREHLSLAATLFGADYDRSIDSIARREIRAIAGVEISLDKLLDEVTHSFDQPAS
jgi:GntR family transcriptional repressor for pyruvate dehydrogenase complex